MSQPSPIRRAALATGLLVTLGLGAWTHWRQQRVPEVVQTGASAFARSGAGEPTLPSAAELERQHGVALGPRTGPHGSLGAVDPFAVRSWQPPSRPSPPPPPVALLPPSAPAPEPSAPALPFQYMGRQERPGAKARTVFFLTRGDEVHAVVPGEGLGSEYRFDGMKEGLLRFTYLPLSVSQALNPGIEP